MQEAIRVLIADDHPVVIAGVRDSLAAAEEIEVVGEAMTGEQTLMLVRTLEPDVLILDMRLPDMTGVDVVKQLRKTKSCVKIIGLSIYKDLIYIRELLALGASGYLIKEESIDSLVDAVRGVANGEKGWLSRRVAAKLGGMLRDNQTEGYSLTDREREVLELVVEGKTNGEVALQLVISEKTVEKHLGSVFQKLGVSSRVEAAVKMVREDLTEQS